MTVVPHRCARENPFRTERVLTCRYHLTEHEWEAVIARFHALGCRGAVVGPEGSGKTTFREDFEQRMQARGWAVCALHLRREQRRLGAHEYRRVRAAGGETLVTLDGGEQLSWLAWWRLLMAARRAAGLLVTLHRDRGVPVLRRHRTDVKVLRELVAELIGHPAAAVLDRQLSEVYAGCEGNIRDALRTLYDWWAAGRIDTIRDGPRGRVTDGSSG